jgi:hypothetical protein
MWSCRKAYMVAKTANVKTVMQCWKNTQQRYCAGPRLDRTRDTSLEHQQVKARWQQAQRNSSKARYKWRSYEISGSKTSEAKNSTFPDSFRNPKHSEGRTKFICKSYSQLKFAIQNHQKLTKLSNSDWFWTGLVEIGSTQLGCGYDFFWVFSFFWIFLTGDRNLTHRLWITQTKIEEKNKP